ncbi:hypothetical protein [Nocardioides sp.]|uniref:hypothetical protein n=1 Tax=Nocardioides sp. TaxID=35761 RepID=UPI002D7F617E|nr:hypothetical protein [Nocardioides sp.]HET8961510.1 hypothetical protein [Nocardioides sp.]
MSEPLPRPRQVTMAGWMIVGGSVLVVATVFDTITSLNTLETRDAVAQFLSEPPGQGLGLDVSGALLVLQTVSMVAAGCAAVAAVLGFHVLRRHRGARLGVTVVAVPLFFTGMVTGGFLSSLVAASALLLWLAPARDWFDGVPARPSSEPARAGWPPEQAPPSPEQAPPSGSAAPPPGQVGAPAPRPHQGFGMQVAPAAVGVPVPRRRPAAVMWACVLTWVISGLAALMMALSALVIAVAPDLVFEELRRQNPGFGSEGVTDRAVQVATYVTAGVTVVWALAAAVLAVLVLRGTGWARIALLVSAITAGVTCLLASLASIVMVLPAFGCAVTFSLLLRPEVRAWFAGHDPMHP